MAFVRAALFEILRKPTVGDVVREMALFLGPLWIAVFVGLVVGWSWKPKWATLGREMSDSAETQAATAAASSLTPSSGFGFLPSLNSLKLQLPNCVGWITDEREGESREYDAAKGGSLCSGSQQQNDKLPVTSADLEHLFKLVEVTDGGPAWIPMMDRSMPTMSYQAWRRDPETGPPQYRSRTVFEDATPELVRNFFWDDEFRPKWDDMLIYSGILEECPTTGTMVVHWVRKFPFFCSDREYIIGRRIWESGRTYYCVTKGIPRSSVPRRNKPRRVDLYYSSWFIRAVESKKGDGRLTACEVLLFHHEDMGIPWEIAKLGVRQGMWGAVKKIEPGLRAYQIARRSKETTSRCAFMAQINTKVNVEYLQSLEEGGDSSEVESSNSKEKPWGRNIPKFLILGGAIALACSLDRGLLTKAVIFGVARRFAKVGRSM